MPIPPTIAVIGGGHAGVEAAIVAARMGAKVNLITRDPGALGRMSCNPAVGGIGKGQVVREIDALGGVMGYLTDRAGIQYRTLNTKKGPAVWSTRAQCDRRNYQQAAIDAIVTQPNIEVISSGVTELSVHGGKLDGVILDDGSKLACDAAILAAGTFMEAILHCGDQITPGGRIGEAPARGLTACLTSHGFVVGRLKTGTPPRLDGSTIDYSAFQPQPGEDNPHGFSRLRPLDLRNDALCYLGYTNRDTHDVIAGDLDRSPLFNGQIQGIGPRYCPSIEDKVHRFPQKERQQLFLEPEGLGTHEIYINGFSTSLPADTQLRALRAIPGLERVEMTRPGYAVEYDFFPPTQVRPTLETKAIAGLYFAGQINGTSGYEEAAGQGLMAGISAVLKCRGEKPVILGRDQAYIGVMIDDLVTKGVDEPYRLFTSRAEYRLILREDNAEQRLSPIGHRLGLIDERIYEAMTARWRSSAELIESLEKVFVSRHIEGGNDNGNGGGSGKIAAAQLLRMPECNWSDLIRRDGTYCHVDPEVARAVEIGVRYRGYVDRQMRDIARFHQWENATIPESLLDGALDAFKVEAREKLKRVRPRTIGQASRIPGIKPSDLTLLMVRIQAWRRGWRDESRESVNV